MCMCTLSIIKNITVTVFLNVFLFSVYKVSSKHCLHHFAFLFSFLFSIFFDEQVKQKLLNNEMCTHFP